MGNGCGCAANASAPVVKPQPNGHATSNGKVEDDGANGNGKAAPLPVAAEPDILPPPKPAATPSAAATQKDAIDEVALQWPICSLEEGPTRLQLWSWVAGSDKTKTKARRKKQAKTEPKRLSYAGGLPGGGEVGLVGYGKSYQELAKRASEADVLPANVEKLIRGDVPRTFFVGQPAPEEDEQQTMERILRAVALWDPALGYCQGVNFLSFFVMSASRSPSAGDGVVEFTPSQLKAIKACSTGSDEADAFWLVVCILRDYGARGLFVEKTPLLKLYSFCLSQLIARRLPELHAFLCGLDSVLGFKWFGTLFTTMLPLPVAQRAWDLVLRDGLHFMLYIALGMCSLMTPALLAAAAEGDEAHEALGNMQRRLPRDATALMPLDFQPQPDEPAGAVEAAAGTRLVKSAIGFAGPGGGIETVEELLALWRTQQPDEAADLGDDFTFRRGKRWQCL